MSGALEHLRSLGVVAGHWLAADPGKVIDAKFYSGWLNRRAAERVSEKALQLIDVFRWRWGGEPELLEMSCEGRAAIVRPFRFGALVVVCDTAAMSEELRHEAAAIIDCACAGGALERRIGKPRMNGGERRRWLLDPGRMSERAASLAMALREHESPE